MPRVETMVLTIKLPTAASEEKCGLCGSPLKAATGPRLFLEDRARVVCTSCGQKHDPSLAALLTLAQVAKRVGNIGRHTVVPPMEALLDLARAAENYSFSMSAPCRRAA
jgi:hypothetical protein